MSANYLPERPHLKTDFQPQPGNDATSEDGPRGLGVSGGAKQDRMPSLWHVREDGRGEAMYRPPPPPPAPLTPLTPPTLTTRGNFPFENRRLSGAVSVVGDLDMSFFDQPNPDYISSSDNSSSTALDTTQTTTPAATPRRKSYTKVIPINSPPRFVTGDDGEMDQHASPPPPLSFSPSSFPSSSPILPLAPHVSFEQQQQQQQQHQPPGLDVQGQIISLTDDSGAGWKRHTRVYGGGVCLACMASGGTGQHGGGFYGENVRPEDRR